MKSLPHILLSALGVMGAFPMPGERRYRLFCILPREGADTTPDVAPLEMEEFADVVRRMSPVPIQLSRAPERRTGRSGSRVPI